MLLMLVDYGIEALILLIVAASVMTWFRPDPRHPVVRTLNGIVEPLLLPIRALLPRTGPVDFSPMVAMVILWFLKSLLHNALSGGPA